jgi:DNA-binding LytR/AlgR family response regulator
MNLHALVLCPDAKIVRILRRVLNELEIDVQHCADADAAIRKLTRHRFEAVIVDCTEQLASQVLRSARSAPCNKRAVAVAIVDGDKTLGSIFELGAHFVLYKPISVERAKSSFRAARALMKRERRRNVRVPVEINIIITRDGVRGEQTALTSDIGEGGIALLQAPRLKSGDRMQVRFTLPGSERILKTAGEVAWENAQHQIGIRFVDLAPDAQSHLNAWLGSHSPEIEQDDPPVPCKLTDLSLGGCYLELPSPYPVQTTLTLSMSAAEVEVRAQGIVRVMHPEIGMGVEFTQRTEPQKEQVEKFIQTLAGNTGVTPNLMVHPESLDAIQEPRTTHPLPGEDPLLDLFLRNPDLTHHAFQLELGKQRGSHSPQDAGMSH